VPDWAYIVLLVVVLALLVPAVRTLRRWADDVEPDATRSAVDRRNRMWVAAAFSMRSSQPGNGSPGGTTLGGTRAVDDAAGVDPDAR
jgi:hypothetical protein